MQLHNDELHRIARLVHRLTGIVLDDTKQYLIESRLASFVVDSGCASYDDLCRIAEANPTGDVARKLVDQLSTHETRFFRDRHPFDALQERVLPEAIERASATSRRARILSIACSTGQEPVSIGMVAVEVLGPAAPELVEVLGIDVSSASVEYARGARYSEFEVRRAERPDVVARWLREEGGRWSVDDLVRQMTRFEQRNVMAGIRDLGMFDIIFCRNVGIYFDDQTRSRLFCSIRDILVPDGVLVLGAAEGIGIDDTRFTIVEHSGSILYWHDPLKRVQRL